MRYQINQYLSLCVLTSLSMLFSVSAHALEFKCWTNDSGVMECGNTIPSQYLSQGYEVRDDQATVVETKSREMSPEERARRLSEERKRIEDEKKSKQQAEEDKRLLDLYPSERDIINGRDLKVGRIDKSIEITEKDLHSRQQRLEKLQVQAERSAKRTDKVSKENLKTLQSHIQSLEGQIETIQTSIASKEKEKLEIQQEAAATLSKYREIQARVTRRIEYLRKKAQEAKKAKEAQRAKN